MISNSLKRLSFFAVTAILASSFAALVLSSPAGAEAGEENVSIYSAPIFKSEDVIVTSSLATQKLASTYSSYREVIIGDKATFFLSKAESLELNKLDSNIIVEENKKFKIDSTQSPTPTWGLDNLDGSISSRFNNAYTYDTTGRGVRIYVLDSGLRTTHADFVGRVGLGYNAMNDGLGYEDCEGHGTHVSGIAAGTKYGVAKEATVVPVRSLRCDGSGTSAEILAAFNWISSTHPGGPAVLNLSLSGDFSASVNNAAQAMIDKGFIVVAAAGNSRSDACSISPASTPNVITVGALANGPATNVFADYSNYGACVDILAPGSDISSDWITSDYAAAIGSGTSMAAPYVAGVAARLLQANPTFKQAEVIAWITEQSIKSSVFGVPTNTTSNSLYAPSIMIKTPTISPSPTASSTPTVSPSPTASPTVTPPVLKPIKPAAKVVLKSKALYISAKVTNDLRREDSFTIKLYRSGKLYKTKIFKIAENIGQIFYTYSNLPKGSYVVKMSSKNSYGTSPLYSSKTFKN